MDSVKRTWQNEMNNSSRRAEFSPERGELPSSSLPARPFSAYQESPKEKMSRLCPNRGPPTSLLQAFYHPSALLSDGGYYKCLAQCLKVTAEYYRGSTNSFKSSRSYTERIINFARKTQRTAVLFLILTALMMSCGGSSWAFTQEGTASYYTTKSCQREGTSGTVTASGLRFNENALTCASWEFPFGTRLLIKNKKNGKTVVCTVTDRGPAKRLYKNGRVVDLSKGAFKAIAPLRDGVVPVTVQVL